MNPLLFVDSWGWIVLANHSDPHHQRVKACYLESIEKGPSIVTTDFILDEVITFLFAKIPVSLASKYLKSLFSSIVAQFIRLEKVGIDRFDKAWKLRLKYSDRPKISFTDFTSFVVMQELSIQRVLTEDHHFEQVNLGFTRVPP